MFGIFQIYFPKIEKRFIDFENKECLYSANVLKKHRETLCDRLTSYYFETYDKDFIDKLRPFIPKCCGGTSLELDYSIPEDLAIIKAQSFHRLIGESPDDKFVNKYSVVNSSNVALSMFIDNYEYDYCCAVNGQVFYLDPLEPSVSSYFKFVIRCDDNWKLCDGTQEEVAQRIIKRHFEKFNSSIHKPIRVDDVNIKRKLQFERLHNTNSKTGYPKNECDKIGYYPYFTMPKSGTESQYINFEDDKLYQEGVEEGWLFAELKNLLKYKDYDLFKRVTVPNIENRNPFCPDIAVLGKNRNLNIRIDIEIDEPYDYKTKTPAHYLDANLDRNKSRDDYMVQNGWIVIRFSERQVAMNAKACAIYVLNLLKKIDSEIVGDYDYELETEPRWSLRQAREFAENNWRETYLNPSHY